VENIAEMRLLLIFCFLLSLLLAIMNCWQFSSSAKKMIGEEDDETAG
jgi:hypothetical protein